MLRTLIVLRDGTEHGTELFSGAGAVNAIQSVTITECVNGAQELTLGSCCANMVEAKIIAPEGGLSIAAGSEIEVYKVDDAGQRHKVGIFTTEKPTRQSANLLSITAYDRVSWLDKDLTQWVAGLADWPYDLHKFAWMVCAACDLELVNTEIPNGDYKVKQFSADGITGRQLMQWIGEIAGRFCRATADGGIEFAWYTPAAISLCASAATASYANETLTINIPGAEVTEGEEGIAIKSKNLQVLDDGEGNVTLVVPQYYFQNGLSFEDYSVAKIEKVQLRQNKEDVGTVYPSNVAKKVNTYIITGNYLLTASTADDLKPVAQVLYDHLADVTYTPCKISIPTSLLIHAGDIVQITDRNGNNITAYVMTKTQSGQKDTLECTGSARRDSSSAVNNQSYEALEGKVLNLRVDVDGIKVENASTAGKIVKLEGDVDGFRTTVSDVSGLKKSVTQLQQDAGQISAKVQSIQDNGVSKVTNEFGLTIDQSAVKIHRTGAEMTNKLNEQGMYIVRNEGKTNETVMLQADAKGVVATDVSVRNYLVVGDNARFEDYSDGTDDKRTACFWVGG